MELEYAEDGILVVPKQSPELIALRTHKKQIKSLEERVNSLEKQLSAFLKEKGELK